MKARASVRDMRMVIVLGAAIGVAVVAGFLIESTPDKPRPTPLHAEPEATSASHPTLPANHPDVSGMEPPPDHTRTVPPASETRDLPAAAIPRAEGKNAYQIAELFAQKTALAGQVVRVRGQVVKITVGVQGKNYFRVRDGSSNEPGKTELVLTSQLEPKRGEVAVFEGVLRTDVDVGIGFVYPILLEDAKLVADSKSSAP